jgi:hypothetical protein
MKRGLGNPKNAISQSNMPIKKNHSAAEPMTIVLAEV